MALIPANVPWWVPSMTSSEQTLSPSQIQRCTENVMSGNASSRALSVVKMSCGSPVNI